MQEQLDGEVLVVAGTSRVGDAVVRRLLGEGAAVVVGDDHETPYAIRHEYVPPHEPDAVRDFLRDHLPARPRAAVLCCPAESAAAVAEDLTCADPALRVVVVAPDDLELPDRIEAETTVVRHGPLADLWLDCRGEPHGLDGTAADGGPATADDVAERVLRVLR
jgi:NAD(P)-dependent dehydrogenase (short-subunit alcohol dehydrogenase family)